jgi:PPOX class probable F420-dependent enzyme
VGDRQAVTAAERLAACPVARLATVGADGSPHIVPVTFVATAERIHTPIDHKPKRTTRLRRLANISHEPRVCLLADHYDDDWERLWWVRVDGVAEVLAPESLRHTAAARALAVKYHHYRSVPIAGPIIEVSSLRWSSWAADPTATGRS